jgi:hypothetical protein
MVAVVQHAYKIRSHETRLLILNVTQVCAKIMVTTLQHSLSRKKQLNLEYIIKFVIHIYCFVKPKLVSLYLCAKAVFLTKTYPYEGTQ